MTWKKKGEGEGEEGDIGLCGSLIFPGPLLEPPLDSPHLHLYWEGKWRGEGEHCRVPCCGIPWEGESIYTIACATWIGHTKACINPFSVNFLLLLNSKHKWKVTDRALIKAGFCNNMKHAEICRHKDQTANHRPCLCQLKPVNGYRLRNWKKLSHALCPMPTRLAWLLGGKTGVVT